MSNLDNVFFALSDATRRAILVKLGSGDLSISELAAPFRMSLPAISRHIKVLENAGLISKAKSKQARPCRLERASFVEIDKYLAQYRRLWNTRLDKIGDTLASDVNKLYSNE